MKLQGRIALITGASRGLGRSLAQRMWHEGANLVLVARSSDRLHSLVNELSKTSSTQRAYALCADLADPSSADAILDRISKLFGCMDILVNNAALQSPIGPLVQNDWEIWTKTIQVNLLAPVALSRGSINLMTGQDRGKIINLSGGGATGPRANFSAYSTAKAGLARFSETLALEVETLHIDVNCVSPGAMPTLMTDEVLEAGPSLAGEQEFRQALKLKNENAELALQRAADLCIFLASAESNGITGKLISAVWDPWSNLAEYKRLLKSSDIYTIRRIIPDDRGFDWGKP